MAVQKHLRLPDEVAAQMEHRDRQAAEAADRFYLFFQDHYEEKLQALYDNAAAEWMQKTMEDLPDAGVI